MIEKNTQYEIAIAALLHDIGKFKQRAYAGKEVGNLSPETLKMECMILPSAKGGRYTHRHALWTYDFFMEDLKPVFDSNQNLLDFNIDRIATLSSQHHNPSDDKYSDIISIADRISASNDRLYKEEYERGMYLTTPLRSILSTISLENKDSSERSLYTYKLKSLNEKGALFPFKDNQINENEYLNLYESFIADLNFAVIEVTNINQFLLKILDLLAEYTWCIPSASNDYLNDISLFDHSKTTMSIALALVTSENKNDSIRICAIGLSGIQSYIFQSKYDSFKNAAKIFRGRSFIVSIFTQAIKISICNKLGLIPFVDCIEAGGNLTMLLPNLDGVDDVLKKFQTELELFMLKKYCGTLAPIMDFSIVIEPSQLGTGKFLGLYKKIGFNLTKQKNRKFSCAISREAYIFDDDLSKSVCSACGTRGIGSDDKLCSICREELELGRNIPKAEYVILSERVGDFELIPGIYLSVAKTIDYTNSRHFVWQLKPEHNQYPLFRINNYVYDISEFSSLASKAVSEGRGKPLLAYIKIDVDCLGQIINEGFPSDLYTVSRFCTLSRSINFFFNTFVPDLLAERFEYSYTVLSGGDDVFVIMPWNEALEFVSLLRKKFKNFCCDNNIFHFSSGIVLADSKTPFAIVNQKANKALDEQAKELEGKDAVSYMDICFKQSELDSFISDSKELQSFVCLDCKKTKPFSMGFLYRLYKYTSDYLYNDEFMLDKYKVFSLLRYDIARNIIPNMSGHEDEYNKAIKFILDKFDNYKNKKEFEKFHAMIIQTIYMCRRCDIKEEDIWE